MPSETSEPKSPPRERRGGLGRWAWGAGLAVLFPVLWTVNALVPRPANLGVREGRLADCPESPNCVSSQTADEAHRVDPLEFGEDPESAVTRLKAILAASPGARLVEEKPGYLAYEFRTPVCRFVDDVEFLVEAPAKVIHVRSASRIGYSDLGANRRRVEAIRRRWGG